MWQKSERLLNILLPTIAISMVIYHLIGIFLSPLDALQHANTHLTFAFLIVFLSGVLNAIQHKSKLNLSIALIFTLLSLTSVIYIYLFADVIPFRTGGISTTPDMLVGVILVVSLLEGTRRTMGKVLPLFGIAFIAYPFLAPHLPGIFYMPSVTFERVLGWICLSLSSGVYGGLIYISANIVFLFILFGVMLEVTGAREFFVMAGILVGRKVRGGAAQTSVVSSALVGSITGAAAANIIITGTVTIPAMKKAGFRSEVAAAIESVASTGGMLLPPVMGVTAFMMMSLTGIPYWTIAKAAVVPALLYYLGISSAVYLHARKNGIGYATEEVDVRLMLRRAPLFIIPFAVIIYLLFQQYSPMYAAGMATVIGLVLGFIRKETRPSLRTLVGAITSGARTASTIAMMLVLSDATFVAIIGNTQLGLSFTHLISSWGGGHLPVVLLTAMGVSMLLGCMSPVSAAYILVALVVTPVLADMGVSTMQAHFFALVFSMIGFQSPPAAPSPLIAAPLANASFFKTAMHSLILVIPGAIVPFLFVYNPALLADFSSGLFGGIVAIIVATLIVALTPVLLARYYMTTLSWPEMGLAAMTLLAFLAYFFAHGNPWVVPAGVICLVSLTLIQWRKASVVSQRNFST